MFTDGSVLQPIVMREGGGGYVMRDADRQVHKGKCAAGARCYSYRAELSALNKSLEDLIAGRDDEGKPIAFPAEGKCEVRIALDSQSVITALEKGAMAQKEAMEMRAWELLAQLGRERRAHITVQYVPGHVGLETQELADETAKEAARARGREGLPTSLSVVKAVMKSEQRGWLVEQVPADHIWRRATGGRAPRQEGIPRQLQRQLAQMRAGRCALTCDVAHRFSSTTKSIEVPRSGDIGVKLGERARVAAVAAGSPAERAGIGCGWGLERVGKEEVTTDGALQAALKRQRGEEVKLHLRKEPSTACPGCGAPQDGTEHLICECPAYASARLAVFGELKPPLTVLSQKPIQVAQYLERVKRTAVQRAPPAAAGAPAPGAAAAAAAGAPPQQPLRSRPPPAAARRRTSSGRGDRAQAGDRAARPHR